MAFYGKTFKKISASNTVDAFELLGLKEEKYGLVQSTDALCTFQKKSDGSIGFMGALGGGLILSNKWYPNQESVFVTATGQIVIIHLKIEHENLLKFIVKTPLGRQLNIDAFFTEYTMKVEFYIPGVDVVTVMYYEAI